MNRGCRGIMKEAVRFLWKERRCHACTRPFLPAGEGTGPGSLFCPDCRGRLTRRVAGYCPSCGELAAWPELPTALCGACLHDAPPWQGVFFYGEYSGLLRSLLLGLKFGGRLVNAYALGSLLAGHPEIKAMLNRVDAVVPVPLHDKRTAQRGYNQALEIARQFLSCSGREGLLSPAALARTFDTLPQRGLSRKERLGNTSAAFHAGAPVKGARVLLVDDIMTTGATLRAATFALQEGGASAVYVAAVARTGRYWRGV